MTAEPSAPLLMISGAVAVLVECANTAPEARTAAAQHELRSITGRSDLTISRRPSGRPRLEPPYPELGVSLSHRAGLLLAAFSPIAAVGADVEVETPDLEPARLAADHFSAAEARAIGPLADGAGARDGFLRLWVAKEAALKVTGRGVYDGMDQPDLAHRLDALAFDGAVIALPASARLPGLRLAVCRVAQPGRPAVYCALAVA